MRLRPLIILTALACARVAFGYQFQTIATLATELGDQFALTYTQLGALIGAYMISGCILALPLGLLGRRVGEGRVLLIGLALMTTGCVHSAFATTAAGIGFGRATAGVGAVAMIVLQNKIIAEWFAGARFMMAISVTVCSFPVGMGLAGLVLPVLMHHFGMTLALLSDALPAAVALALFGISYREPVLEAPPVRRFALPTGREAVLLTIAGFAWMVYTAGFSGFASYLPASMSLRGYDLPVIGVVMAIATWGNVAGTLSGGSLATRLGGQTVFLAGTSFLVVGMLMLTLTPWAVGGALVLGVLGSIQPGVLMAAGTFSARPDNRAVGMGLFYTIYYLGGAFVPAVCGLAADSAGRPEGGLLAAAALSALAIPAFILHRMLLFRRGVYCNV